MDATSRTPSGHGGPPQSVRRPTVFHQAITRILAGGLSAHDLAHMAHRDESTISRWANGDTMPMLEHVAILLDNLRADGRHAEADLIIAVLDRRGGGARQAEPLDLDGDGKVGAADAIAGCVQVVVSAADAMKETEAACRDGRLSETELTGLLHNLAIVEEKCRRTRGAVQAAYERGRLRPARRITHPGLNGSAH